MEYVCVNARFLFFDGNERFTVEYSYSLAMWFIFSDTDTNGCVFKKINERVKSKNVNSINAELILYQYLQSL